MSYAIAAFIALCLILVLILAFKLLSMFEMNGNGIQHDKGGVASNPPNFIEVLKRKTLNIKFGKYDIIVEQVSFIEGIYGIANIQTAFNVLNEACGYNGSIKVDEKHIKEYVTFVALLSNCIFDLSKKYVKKKEHKKYFEALRRKIYEDAEFAASLSEQIIDFWTYVKKKVEVLATGRTARQTYGEAYIQGYVKTDLQGKTYLTPRYGKHLNFTQN